MAGAKGLGSASAQKLWKNKTEDSESDPRAIRIRTSEGHDVGAESLAVPRPRPLQIEYNSGLSEEDNEIFEDCIECRCQAKIGVLRHVPPAGAS